MDGVTTNTPLALAQRYIQLGINPLPIPYRDKGCYLEDWSKLKIGPDNVSTYFGDGRSNIGGSMGALSSHIVDIDCDWPEAAQVAPLLAPKSWSFGRKVDGVLQCRHILLRVPDAKTLKIKAAADSFDIKNTKGLTIIELLASGTQVVLPGSTHKETGEPIQWINTPKNIDIAELSADEAYQLIKRIAGAALLIRLWPDMEGSRHEASLGIAGACFHAGWAAKDIEQTLTAVFRVVNDGEGRDRLKAVVDTLESAQQGNAVSGVPKLSEYIPSLYLDKLCELWGLGSEPVELLSGGKPLGSGDTETIKPLSDDLDEWYPPEAVFDVHIPATTYPVEALGDVLGGAAKAMHKSIQAPIETCGQSLLTTGALIAQPLFNIVPPHGGDMPLSLDALTVSGSGDRKTKVDTIATKPIRDIELVLHAQYVTEKGGYENKLEVLRDARKNTQKAARDKKLSVDASQAKLDALGPDPEQPKHPYLLSDDPTVEGLYRSFKEGYPSQGNFTDEGGVLVGGYALNDQNLLKTIAKLSKIYDGGPLDKTRGGDERGKLYNCRLSLHWMMQPDVGYELFEKKIAMSQGFFPRCLLSIPDTLAGGRAYKQDNPADNKTIQRYWATAAALLKPDTWEYDETHPTHLKFKPLRLDKEAVLVFEDFYNRHEETIGQKGSMEHMQAFVSRTAEQALRIAAVLMVFDGGAEITHINKSAMERGCLLADYSLSEWNRLYLASRLIDKNALGRKLLDWLQENGKVEFYGVEVLRHGPYQLRDAKTRDKAIKVLVDAGWLRKLPKGKVIDKGYRKDVWQVWYEGRPGTVT